MHRYLKIVCFYFGFSFLFPLLSFSQKDTLNSLINSFSSYREQTLQEKIYVHVDRPVHLAGEVIWFKVYTTDAVLHKPLNLSKVAYAELLDNDRKAVLQTKIELNNGVGSGSLVLPANFPSGNYVLRAYTAWMKNFDPALFYHQQLTVVNSFKNPGLKPEKDTVWYDVQFFPEGGHFVNGQKTKVGLKVTDKTGKGADVKGFILNVKNDTVAKFSTLKYGLGSFLFTPIAQTEYRAFVKDGKKKPIKVQFPVIATGEWSLSLDSFSDSSKIKIEVARADGNVAIPVVYLFSHTRKVIKMAESAYLNQGKAAFVVDKKTLGEGITHFTLFDANKQPVAERLFFKQPANKLAIQLQSDKNSYTAREKITISADSKSTGNGQAAVADLSLSVYLLDSLQGKPQDDILSYLWLTSDISGKIEGAAYYFSANTAEVQQAADNLMLTQGWRRFKWSEVLSGTMPKFDFLPEYNGPLVQGRVVNRTDGKPAAGINSYLASPGTLVRTYGSVSDAAGNVKYEMKEFYGAKEIIAETNSLIDSAYKVEIASPFAPVYSSYSAFPFDLAENTKNALVTRSIATQTQNIYFDGSINTFRPLKFDSLAFYGTPDEKYRLDDFTRFKTMEDVLREYVPGVQVRTRKGKFRFMVHNPANRTIFEDNPLVLLDGVPVFNIDTIMHYDPLKIKKLEVVTQKYYLGPYIYSGIVSFTTYKGDMSGFPLDPKWLILDYEGLQLQREFFSPAYASQKQQENRLPDFRNLLYWSPCVVTDKEGKASVSFYASDMKGKYLIVAEGLSANGQAGTSMSTFDVVK